MVSRQAKVGRIEMDKQGERGRDDRSLREGGGDRTEGNVRVGGGRNEERGQKEI